MSCDFSSLDAYTCGVLTRDDVSPPVADWLEVTYELWGNPILQYSSTPKIGAMEH